MNPARLLDDLALVPASLRAYAHLLRTDNPWQGTPVPGARRIILLGMGSSAFAAGLAAAHLQAAGENAVAAVASSTILPGVGPDSVVIAISATGSSPETLAAAQQYTGRAPVIAVTNTPGSPLTELAAATVELHAGVEVSGVACRSYRHTLALLMSLLMRAEPTATAIADAAERAAEATEDLLDRTAGWAPRAGELLLGRDGTAIVAPADRLASAWQSALMLRESPRLLAIAAETGDWSHIEVYLTRTTDYRMLLLTGSPWQTTLLQWCAERSSTVVAVGEDLPGVSMVIRHRHDDDRQVRMLCEVLIAEVIAAEAFLRGEGLPRR